MEPRRLLAPQYTFVRRTTVVETVKSTATTIDNTAAAVTANTEEATKRSIVDTREHRVLCTPTHPLPFVSGPAIGPAAIKMAITTNTGKRGTNSVTLYHHNPNDNIHWELSDYTVVANITTQEELAAVTILLTRVNPAVICMGMFFLFRGNVQPRYEDPCNTQGGCFKYKINHNDLPRIWERMTYAFAMGCMVVSAKYLTQKHQEAQNNRKSRMGGATETMDDYDETTSTNAQELVALLESQIQNAQSLSQQIMGISTSPKRGFSIVNIWVSTCNQLDSRFINKHNTGLNKSACADECLFEAHKKKYKM